MLATYLNLELILNIAQILAIPVTVAVIVLLLRPILREFIARSTRIEVHPLTLERLEVGESFQSQTKDESKAAEGQESRHGKRPQSLQETSKEKLEKLRLLLESEQINQLIQYHANSLQQAKISFSFSIGAACLGFLVIIIGIALTVYGPASSTSYISIISGAVIDAVASLFFVQSNQARKSMTEFFDKLRLDRQFNESLRLCDSIGDLTVQSLLKAQLALFFSGMPNHADCLKILQTSPTANGVTASTRTGQAEQPKGT